MWLTPGVGWFLFQTTSATGSVGTGGFAYIMLKHSGCHVNHGKEGGKSFGPTVGALAIPISSISVVIS